MRALGPRTRSTGGSEPRSSRERAGSSVAADLSESGRGLPRTLVGVGDQPIRSVLISRQPMAILRQFGCVGTRRGSTAGNADRAVLIRLIRFLAVIQGSGVPPGRQRESNRVAWAQQLRTATWRPTGSWPASSWSGCNVYSAERTDGHPRPGRVTLDPHHSGITRTMRPAGSTTMRGPLQMSSPYGMPGAASMARAMSALGRR